MANAVVIRPQSQDSLGYPGLRIGSDLLG